MVITWSRLAGMKFYSVLSRSRHCYKLFINHILQLHVNSFVPSRRDPFSVLPRSRFVGTKFSHVIASACINRMKKCKKKKCKQIYPNTMWKTVSPCRDEIWFHHVMVRWNLPWLDGLKFRPGKPGSCNHHLNLDPSQSLQ